MDSGGQWSSSPQINGKAYAANYASPTSAELTTAVSDMENAYNDAAGRPDDDGERTNLGAGKISGEILTPGVYAFDVDIMFSTDIAFQGDANDVFIVQGKQSLIQTEGTKVTLVGGAQAKNIFWQIAGSVSVGKFAVTGCPLGQEGRFVCDWFLPHGRVLSQTACNLQMAVITEPLE
jgi:hypothetical protein